MAKLLKVAIIGEPNAGKSTLLNKIIGQNISIVTHKVQTTREVIRGIYTNGETQIVFLDTPGIFNAERNLEKYIVSNAMSSFEEADVVCLIMDLRKINSGSHAAILKAIKDLNKPIIGLINKIDMVKRNDILPLIQKLSEEFGFAEIVPMSAEKGDGVKRYLEVLEKYAYDDMHIYSEDEITDKPIRFIAEEITRKHAFLHLHKELPYSLKVETEKWDEFDDEVKIYQTIYLVKDSQKNIAVGKGGTKIKMIGTDARKEIQQLIDKKVHLYLYIKVREEWMEKDFNKFS